MTQQQIIEKVKSLLNEMKAVPDSESGADEDNLRLDDYIASSIPDAVLQVQRGSATGPVNIRTADVVQGSLVTRADGTGYLFLPDDYLLLRCLLMKGWSRPCVAAYSMGSPMERAQRNAHSRAGSDKPVCVESRDAAGRRILEYFSVGSGVEPQVMQFAYEVPYNAANGLSPACDASLALAVCYMCAALVLTVFENKNGAETLMGIASSFMKN